MARLHRYSMEDAPARLLASAGIRPTPQRVAVLGALDMAGAPISAEDVRQAILPLTVGTPTIYRTLHLFAQSGWVKTVFIEGSVGAHFVRVHADRGRQLILCRRCGQAAGLDAPPVQALLGFAAEHSGHRSIQAHLTLTGICPACQSALKGRERQGERP